jgi:hypothetical protein
LPVSATVTPPLPIDTVCLDLGAVKGAPANAQSATCGTRMRAMRGF